METDKDHIHLLVSYPPRISISSIVRKIKQESTIMLWKYNPLYLSKHFLKEYTFWSDGYFVCSIGEQVLTLLEDTLKIRANGIHPID